MTGDGTVFKIPYDAFCISLFTIPVLSCLLTFRLFPARSCGTKVLLTIGMAFLLFVPGCIATCFLIEPLYTYQGARPAADVPDVFWVKPPPQAESIEYFKNTVYETYLCKLDENEFVRWCEANDMRKDESKFSQLGYPNFRDRVPSAIDRRFIRKTLSPRGASYRAVYFRQNETMVYEAAYW